MNEAKYIGLDVHQATISVAVLDAAGGLVMEAILETKAETILQFSAACAAVLHVTFAEGPAPLGCTIFTQALLCDPRKNALLEAWNKDDRIDVRRPPSCLAWLIHQRRES